MGLIQWKDKEGRAWSFRLEIADAKRLKEAGFDLGDPKGYQKAFSNPLECIEVIAEAMRPQWEQAELNYEQFVKLITDSVGALQEVQQCFVEGIKDFFLRLGENAMATIVEKALKAAKTTKAAMAARADSQAVEAFIAKAIEKDESDFQKRLAEEEAKLFGETSTSAPGSSDATQDSGPTES